ncbi:conserved oligomeric Golgi complex subunit 6 [Tetranychus urticae]|uniref:Conserved oligomeric Golgi complex subunit 6 n=1 Tax=Tetranychus urticae TaxID=32264 RepID=T1K467_TETUR|nr:conserved oligomeric Golgi complex subunit 6 [Tetranychus urticae]
MDGSISNTMLNKKIAKLLESDLDHDKETLEAVKILSSCFTDNTITIRRNLSNTLEKRSLVIIENFQSCFGEIKRLMESLHLDLTSMNQSCLQTMNKIKNLKTKNQNLLEKTHYLKNERKTVDIQQAIVDKFLDRFHLKPHEIAILKGLPSKEDPHQPLPMTETFFELLGKCRQIHEDSKILLSSSQQTTGIETMDAMSVLEEAAFERLYKWTLNALRSFNPDSMEMNNLLFKAIGFISERTVLLKNCLDEYGTIRRAAVVRNLIDALTRGGPGGNPPPFDLNSNDPVRYVGDILTWVHQAIASEKELLVQLLQQCDPTTFKEINPIKTSLSFIMESLNRPIKARIEQLLMSEPSSTKSHGPLVLFKIKNLIKFYSKVFSTELLPDSQLVYTMVEIDSLAHRVFINSLNFHCAYKLGKSADGDNEQPPIDLTPTDSLMQTIYLIDQILSFQNSFILSPVDRQEIMITMVNVVIKPLIQACRVCAAKLPGLEMSIFLLNCFHEIYQIISKCEFVDEFKEALENQINDYQTSLINENASNIITYFGLTAVYYAIKNEANLPLSSITGCDALALQFCSKKVDFFLAKPDNFQLPQLSYLKSVELRDNIKRKSLEFLCQMYREIYEAINKKENEYDEPESLLTQTPDHFSSILL